MKGGGGEGGLAELCDVCVDEAGVVVMSAFNREGEQQRPLAGRFDGTDDVTVSIWRPLVQNTQPCQRERRTQKKIALADGMTIQRRTDLLPKTIANIGKNKTLPPF